MKRQRDTAQDARREVMDLIATTGIRAAAEAAIAVCRDASAPAPARATASGLLFRAAALGGFGKDAEDNDDKPPSEMSPAELARALKRTRRALAVSRGEEVEDDVDEDEGDEEVSDVLG